MKVTIIFVPIDSQTMQSLHKECRMNDVLYILCVLLVLFLLCYAIQLCYWHYTSLSSGFYKYDFDQDASSELVVDQRFPDLTSIFDVSFSATLVSSNWKWMQQSIHLMLKNRNSQYWCENLDSASWLVCLCLCVDSSTGEPQIRWLWLSKHAPFVFELQSAPGPWSLHCATSFPTCLLILCHVNMCSAVVSLMI